MKRQQPAGHPGGFSLPSFQSRRKISETPGRSQDWQDSGVVMPRKGTTGHDGWVITEALATALIALEQLPPQHQPRTHMDDIRKILAAACEPETVALHLAQAKCRLFPDLDRPTIYQEYGLGDGQG
jgi:hypothetical protein